MNVLSAVAKPFTWSYSKLKNYETCPRRYNEIDVLKNFAQPRSEALDRGDEMHDAMRERVQHSKPLPPQFSYMEAWAKKLTTVIHPKQIIQCELKLSNNREGKPTGYFDKATWFRSKIDYLRIVPAHVAPNGEEEDFAHVVDYKTGKPPRVWDGTQLLLNAWQIFQAYSTVQNLRVDYLWTEYNDTSHEVYRRTDIPGHMVNLLPRVMMMEQAHANDDFPPTPNPLCQEWCDVTTCEFHGKKLKR